MVEENGEPPPPESKKSMTEIEMAEETRDSHLPEYKKSLPEIQMVQESGHPPSPESKNLLEEIEDQNEEMPPRSTVDKGKRPMEYNDDDVDIEEFKHDSDSDEEDEQFTGGLFLGHDNLKFHRKLTRYDQRALRLSCQEAYMLTGNKILTTPPLQFVPVTDYRENLTIRDFSEFVYKMSLTCKGLTAGRRVYDLGGDWGVFLQKYGLAPNDEVFFYRVENYGSRGAACIMITGSKNTDDCDDEQFKECIDRVRKNKLPGVMIDGPKTEGSTYERVMKGVDDLLALSESYMSSYTEKDYAQLLPKHGMQDVVAQLTTPMARMLPMHKFAPRYVPDGVTPNEQSSSYFRPQDMLLIHLLQERDSLVLALRYAEAYLLTKDKTILQRPRSLYKKKFTGYDLCGLEYILEVTNWTDEDGEIHYVVGNQWRNFMSMHHLKPGDEITFYQIQRCQPNGEFCVALRFFKRPKDKQ